MSNPLTALPRIDDLLAGAEQLVARYGRRPVTAALRAAVDDARAAMRAGEADPPVPDVLVATAARDLAARFPGPPRPVINAAGVIIHTNLGRAPLPAHALAAVAAAGGYCDLEYDLESGTRGKRDSRLSGLLTELTGAEAGLAVNNAAAALVLVLAACATGKGVVVSRGELVEIGGGFRLPEIMAAAGSRLIEVGTTNRTRAADYRMGDDVALILKVHQSNFRITGFTEAPSAAELADVAAERGVPLVHDVGSGLIEDQAQPALAAEPSVRGSLAAGADLVIFSGDKILGGPQAGLIVGRADLVDACRTHPLARALRLDKLGIAALAATLQAHLQGAATTIPVWQMLQADESALSERAAAFAAIVDGTVVDAVTLVGGGTAPDAGVPSPVIRVACATPDDATARLRNSDPPIIVRVTDDALWIDLRTVPADADKQVAAAVAAAVRAEPD